MPKVSAYSAVTGLATLATDILYGVFNSVSKKITMAQLAIGLERNGLACGTISTLTYAGTVDIDFATLLGIQKITLTGDLELTTSNRAASRRVLILLIGDSVDRALTLPSWDWFTAPPTTLTANKKALLDLTCTGTTDASIIATYLEQP
jgi:hypothetical protein